MATTVDVGFVEMRLAKVVAVAVPPDEPPSYCMVLEGVSQDRQLPIEIGSAEALTLSATLTGVGFGRPMSPQFAAGLLRALGPAGTHRPADNGLGRDGVRLHRRGRGAVRRRGSRRLRRVPGWLG